MNFLKQVLVRLWRAVKGAKALAKYLGVVLRQTYAWVKRGRLKCAANYFWARIFSIEEGLALLTPLYVLNPNLAPYPRRIELEVTNKCCLRCLKCEHTYWEIKEEDMSFEQFEKVIQMFPPLRAISVTGIGHGFENKEYLKMLKYLKDRSLFVQFFDPLFLPNEQQLREVVKMGVDWIWMSFDGATKETYEKLQAGSNFERVINNVKTLMRLKKEMHTTFPELHFQFIVTKDNINEMPAFVELIAALIGEQQLLTTIQFIKLIPFKENEYLLPEVTGEIVCKTEQCARQYKNLSVKFIHFRKQNPPINECVAWTVPFITVDGTVYPCCSLTEGNIRHLVRDHTFGNVFETPFAQIWNSSKFKGFRTAIHQGKVPALCCKFRKCALYDVSGCRQKCEGEK